MDNPPKYQMTIHIGIEKAKELGIQTSNDADLERATANFFHCKYKCDQIVESTWCQRMIDFAQLEGKGFKFLGKKCGVSICADCSCI